MSLVSRVTETPLSPRSLCLFPPDEAKRERTPHASMPFADPMSDAAEYVNTSSQTLTNTLPTGDETVFGLLQNSCEGRANLLCGIGV